jgi:hypothetical protein
VSFASALARLFSRGGEEVVTTVAERGGVAARVEREAAAKELESGVAKKGASLPTTTAPKTKAPTEVRTINPEKVTTDAGNVGRADLKPAVKPLAIGVAAAGTLAAAGYAASKVGDAIYQSHEEQIPYTHDLPGGGIIYTDPVTGESYVITPKQGGASVEDPSGNTPTAPPTGDATNTSYTLQPVTGPERAAAKSQESVFSGLFNPLVLLAIAAVVIVIVLAASRSRSASSGGA